MSTRALSYAHGVSSTPLMGETIGEALASAAVKWSDNEALVSIFEGRRYTFHQLNAEVDRVAGALLTLGVAKGDRIGIWSTNCAAWTLIQCATARIGAVLVCINPAYQQIELRYALQQSECSHLICGEGFRQVVYADMLRALLPLTSAEGEVQARDFPSLRRIVHLRREPETGFLSWDAFLQRAANVDSDAVRERSMTLDRDDIVNIQYTSGTTGVPKGAMLSHHSILNNGYWVGERMRFTPKDRLCIPVPFYHCFGMVMGNLACITHGAAMILPAPHFSPAATLEAISAERCTAVYGVPSMFIAELEHPQFSEFNLNSLRTGIMAGAPCPVEVMNRVVAQMHCREILIACGMTETSPVCNMTEADDSIEIRTSTIGKVMPHQEQKIIDPATGLTLARNQQGELCYRGYNVMRGYYNNLEATRLTIDAGGWLHSGDLAVMDDKGYVRITGRLKDMISRGGEKIFPREVEEFLFTHPDIIDVHVFGVPDSYYGEAVMAWVRAKGPLCAEDVRAFCKGRIMDYKIPKYVKLVEEFPTTVTGKIQKYRMREISAVELGLVVREGQH